MAPRKKRGNKTAVNRKAKASTASNLLPNVTTDTDTIVKSQAMDVDSKNNTIIDCINDTRRMKVVVNREHKKFGKFRFLLENNGNCIDTMDSSVPPKNDIIGTNCANEIDTQPLFVQPNVLDEMPTYVINANAEIVQETCTINIDEEESNATVEEEEYTIAYLSEQDTTDSVIETEIVEECQEVYEIDSMNTENEETFSNVVEIQAESESTNSAQDINETMLANNEVVVQEEQQTEIVIAEACVQEQVIPFDNNVPAQVEGAEEINTISEKEEDKSSMKVIEEHVEEAATSTSNHLEEIEMIIVKQELEEETIEEKLEKITMNESSEMNKPVPRRSRRKLNQKEIEKQNPANEIVENPGQKLKIEETLIPKVEVIDLDCQTTEQIDHEAIVQIEEDNQNKKIKKTTKNKTDDSKEDSATNLDKKLKKEQKPKQKQNKAKDTKKKNSKEEQNERNIRRSNRIKSISVQKQKSKGHGVVKGKKGPNEPDDANNATNKEKTGDVVFPFPKLDVEHKPVKVKSRWRRSSELEMYQNSSRSNSPMIMDAVPLPSINTNDELKKRTDKEEVQKRLKQFIHIRENHYLTERMSCKEAKKMTCDCFLTQEEIDGKEFGCGDDCLNKLLMIECGQLCSVGDRCTNKRFQKGQFAPCEVFKTDKKGLGIRAAANIPYGEFILEYVGEVLDPDEFEKRADNYSKDKNIHYYFMSLRSDAVIDATQKGNISRFINHSCDPNAETQKWTVNGELRIGFFSKRTIFAGEEITFDYQFQRYGKEAQKCYCESESCRGWLGEEPDDDDDEDDDEDEEEEEDGGKEIKDATKLEDVKEDDAKTDSDTVQKPIKAKPTRRERKKTDKTKKSMKDLFDDLDLDEEIETLLTTGLKNQAHTLKLSRLMVRAKETVQRIHLLDLLRDGEFPCRRLFLDYHGLRLIHGWMTDLHRSAKGETKVENIRLKILQTLAALPIPNKTMLNDSKVLPMVEQWAEAKFDSGSSPLDSETNSPQINEVKITGNGETQNSEKIDSTAMVPSSTTLPDEKDVVTPEPPQGKEDIDYTEQMTSLAKKLLSDWSGLKEVFRIPKKERIEQMKEHEREANQGYMAGLGLEQYNATDKKCESRYRINQKCKIEKVDMDRSRKISKLSGHKINPKMSKYERRKMFALKVEQEAEERRRQQEFWRQHEENCMMIGADPRFTAPFDPSRGYQYVWNPQSGQWQNYKLPNNSTSMSHRNYYGSNNIPLTSNFPSHQNGMMNVGRNMNIHGTSMSSSMNMQNPIPTIGGGITSIGNNISTIGGNGKNMPGLPALPYQECIEKPEIVKFMGPIPPPVKLPPKWKCVKDKYGRPYYYHIKIRRSQWEPPDLTRAEIQDELSETTSSSDTSSLSSDTSSDDSDSEDDIDDSRLLLEIKKKFKILEEETKISDIKTPEENLEVNIDEAQTEQAPDTEVQPSVQEEEVNTNLVVVPAAATTTTSSPPPKEATELPPVKKRRTGLVQEIIISPRTEEEKLQFKESMKKVKENKERQKRHKEMALKLNKKQPDASKGQKPTKKHKVTVKTKLKETITDASSESSRRIKDTFRSNMAGVMVSILNHYRKPDCKEGKITNTDDFKHLARKLTHFVMLKELKHCQNIEDLTCTESVKAKAKEFVRKYMSKFGEIYQRPKDDLDSF